MVRLPVCHNPCFSGQCFAINIASGIYNTTYVTILVLVDSVLQLNPTNQNVNWSFSHNPCFSGQCFAIVYIGGYNDPSS